MRAWNRGKAGDFDGPSRTQMLWMGLYDFPEPKPTQNCSRPNVLKKKRTASTTTSCGPGEQHVPNVGIYAKYRKMSASEWLRGCTLDKLQGLLERTDSCFVVSSNLPSILSLAIISLIKGNSSFLFSSSLKKPLFQSRFGICVLPSPTLVLGPHPCRLCASVLRLSQE